jgi:hypothetical protein
VGTAPLTASTFWMLISSMVGSKTCTSHPARLMMSSSNDTWPLLPNEYTRQAFFRNRGAPHTYFAANQPLILAISEGYDAMLLPVVLGGTGTLFKCLDRATKEMDISNARKKKLYSKPAQYAQSTGSWVPTRYLKRQKSTADSRGKV